MLQLDRVSLSYGSFRALDNVSLHAGAGELVVLLGANGAGKSSIFLAMSGIHRINGGTMRFEGRELSGMKPSQIVQAGLVHCPEGRKLFPAMSVEKNLTLGAYVHRRDRAPAFCRPSFSSSGRRRGLNSPSARPDFVRRR